MIGLTTSVNIPIISGVKLPLPVIYPVTVNDVPVLLSAVKLASIMKTALPESVTTLITSPVVKALETKRLSQFFIPTEREGAFRWIVCVT